MTPERLCKPPKDTTMTLQETIIATAIKYLGEEEIEGNKGFKNKEFEKEMKAVGFVSGYAWCALFAELVWVTSAHKCNLPPLGAMMSRLFSTGAYATWTNFDLESGKGTFLTLDTPQPSDLVVWRKQKNGVWHWTGHMGIVIDINGEKYTTIEGNTTGKPEDREGVRVAQKTRTIDFTTKPNGLNLLGFVHIV